MAAISPPAETSTRPAFRHTDSRIGHHVVKVDVERLFPCSVERLWHIAGHPGQVAGLVPTVTRFKAPKTIAVGEPVSETHRFLGWAQRYHGTITRYEEGVAWGMSSKPVGLGPFPLPHIVIYRFSRNENGSQLAIACECELPRILSLVSAQSLAATILKAAVNRIFSDLTPLVAAYPQKSVAQAWGPIA